MEYAFFLTKESVRLFDLPTINFHQWVLPRFHGQFR